MSVGRSVDNARVENRRRYLKLLENSFCSTSHSSSFYSASSSAMVVGLKEPGTSLIELGKGLEHGAWDGSKNE